LVKVVFSLQISLITIKGYFTGACYGKRTLRALPCPYILFLIVEMTIIKTSNPEQSTLTRKQLLLLHETAKEIQQITEKNLDNIRCLLDEINHLSKWFRWTTEEKNLVLFLKLKGRLTEKLTHFDIFGDWMKNCKYITKF
jgi:hypothetical protein